MLKDDFYLIINKKLTMRQGIKEPTFHRSQLPELAEELECWD